MDTTIVFQTRPYGSFIQIKSNLRRKKLHRTNQSSNFLGSSFGKKEKVSAPNQFMREIESQHLKILFFFENRPIHFHINCTRVIRPFPNILKYWDHRGDYPTFWKTTFLQKYIVTYSASMYENLGSQFCRTITGIQSGLDAFNETRWVMILLTLYCRMLKNGQIYFKNLAV